MQFCWLFDIWRFTYCWKIKDKEKRFASNFVYRFIVLCTIFQTYSSKFIHHDHEKLTIDIRWLFKTIVTSKMVILTSKQIFEYWKQISRPLRSKTFTSIMLWFEGHFKKAKVSWSHQKTNFHQKRRFHSFFVKLETDFNEYSRFHRFDEKFTFNQKRTEFTENRYKLAPSLKLTRVEFYSVNFFSWKNGRKIRSWKWASRIENWIQFCS